LPELNLKIADGTDQNIDKNGEDDIDFDEL